LDIISANTPLIVISIGRAPNKQLMSSEIAPAFLPQNLVNSFLPLSRSAADRRNEAAPNEFPHPSFSLHFILDETG
jgi:hypothetical protein